ncbi:MAG: hypothetical protein H7Z72_13300 [Bacteroidetes bacterium]|nr:hypothetical protein [Fibrella sp.]
MKPIHLLPVILVFSVFSCGKNDPELCCSCREQSGSPVPYQYPPSSEITPLPYLEKLPRIQIPNQQLKNICTYDLVESYLTYPLINVLGFSNNFKDAFVRLTNDFNGAKELTNRNDGPAQLLKRHKLNNFTNFDLSWESKKQFDYKWTLMLLELTLSQDQILSKASAETKNELFKSAMQVKARRNTNPELFSFPNTGSNDFLIASVLFSTGYRPFTEYVASTPSVRNYLNGYLQGSIGTTQRLQIDKFANQYLATLPK